MADARDGRRGDRDRDRHEDNDRNWRDNDGNSNLRRGDNDNQRSGNQHPFRHGEIIGDYFRLIITKLMSSVRSAKPRR